MSEALIRECIDGGWVPENDAELRLARRVSWVVDAVESRVTGDIDRALLGVGTADPAGRTLEDRIRIATACFDSGVSGQAGDLATLESDAMLTERPDLFIPAARAFAQISTERETSARIALSEQSLPYVFPGDVHPLMMDVLACGERILPALHVDWLRKLTAWLAPAVAVDCAAMGLWFWPVLDVLDIKKMSRELSKRIKRPAPRGARGLMAAYGTRLALPLDPGPHIEDRRIHALSVLGNIAG